MYLRSYVLAGGSLILGGIVAGFIMAAKSLANAKKVYSEAKNVAEKMKTITSFMESVEEICITIE